MERVQRDARKKEGKGEREEEEERELTFPLL